MPRPSLPRDPNALASIIEAMIFASEEPVPPRTLLRLLFEDPDQKSEKAKQKDAPLFENGTIGDSVDSGEEREETEMIADDVEEGSGEENADDESPEGGEEGPDEEELPQEAEESTGRRDQKRGMGQKELREVIDQLNDLYDQEGRSFRIVEIAGGFQFATTKDYAEFVGLLSRDRAKRRLSPAALETLSIIAYRQPVTKPEVEAIRGVNCDQVLVSLMERELITISGRADSVGRPLLYSTTDAFLRAFGLNSLSDLPKLRELEELMEDDAISASRPGDMPPEFALGLDDPQEGEEGETEGDQGDESGTTSVEESASDQPETPGEGTEEIPDPEMDAQVAEEIGEVPPEEGEEEGAVSEKKAAELVEGEEGVTIVVNMPEENGEPEEVTEEREDSVSSES